METCGRESDTGGGRAAKTERIEHFGLAVGTLLLLYFTFHVFAFVKDDAFITYRYAWHLRHGYGAVFNPDQRVEGYSCPLYMALTALLMCLPGDVLFRAKLLGLACALATLWAVWQLARELRLPPSVCAAAPLLLGANASFALSAVDGMETTLQAFLVTLAALLVAREQHTGKGLLSAIVLLAAALNRAEGAIYFVAAVAPYVAGMRRHGVQRRDALWALTFIAPYALFLLWRHSYYGDWLPNTVHAKSIPLAIALRPSMGPAYLLKTLFMVQNKRNTLFSATLWLVAIWGGISAVARRNVLTVDPDTASGIDTDNNTGSHTNSTSILMVPLGVALQALVALCSGGDWMEGWRYMTAALPLWILLIVLGLHNLIDMPMLLRRIDIDLVGGRLLRLVYVALALSFLYAGWEYRDIGWKYRGTERRSVSWAEVGWTTSSRRMLGQTYIHAFVQTSDYLNALLPSGSLVAYSQMGVIPYYTLQLRWLDTDGLTDYEVAHLKGVLHGRTGIITTDVLLPTTDVGKLLLRRRPDYIIMTDASEYPYAPVLNGSYVPFFSTVLDLHHNVKLLIWKRRTP